MCLFSFNHLWPPPPKKKQLPPPVFLDVMPHLCNNGGWGYCANFQESLQIFWWGSGQGWDAATGRASLDGTGRDGIEWGKRSNRFLLNALLNMKLSKFSAVFFFCLFFSGEYNLAFSQSEIPSGLVSALGWELFSNWVRNRFFKFDFYWIYHRRTPIKVWWCDKDREKANLALRHKGQVSCTRKGSETLTHPCSIECG